MTTNEEEKIIEIVNKKIDLGEEMYDKVVNINNIDEDIRKDIGNDCWKGRTDDDIFSLYSKKIESIERVIENKLKIIYENDKIKEKLIKQIIGQLYNGTLVKNGLSVRKGNIHTYRCQKSPRIYEIKETILKNIQEISEKLNDNSLDIIEFLLNKVYSTDNNSKRIKKYNNYYRYDTLIRNKIIDIKPIKIMINDDYQRYSKYKIIKAKNGNEDMKLNIYNINMIVIDGEDGIDFINKIENKDKGEVNYIFPSLDDNDKISLFIKYKNEILNGFDELMKEMDIEIKNFDKDINEIKLKGENQLALCELMK